MQPKRTSPRVPDVIDKHVSKRVRMQRLSKGLTQTGMCERLGLSLASYQAYEAGRRKWTAYRLLTIAQALGCDVSRFFEDAPQGYDPAPPVDVGTTENGDTRRLLRAWDAITGTARKNVLCIALALARGSQAAAELRQARQ